MSSTSLRVLLVSALVVVCTHAAATPTAKLSPQAKKVLDDVYGLSLSTKCSTYFTGAHPKTNYATDTAVSRLCNDIKTANKRTKLQTAKCLAADFTIFERSACDKVTKFNDAWAKKLKTYTADVKSLSGPCTAAAGNVASWFDLEQLCSNVKTIKTTTFKKACPQNEYSKLEKAACGGASPTAKLSPQAKKVLDDVYGLSLSTKCSNYLNKTPKTNYVTDTAVSGLCNDIKTTFKKACPQNEYSKLEKAACGGASGVLVGLMTLGLCLVTSLFSKQ